MKRLVLCCDGTWCFPDQSDGETSCPSNVTKFALGVADRDKDGVEQILFYHRGVGTGRWDRIRGGAFGFGLSRDVQDVYRFIVEYYEPGDELYFIGFSRGAFTARSTAGFVRNAGVLRREFVDRIGTAFRFYRDRSSKTKPSTIEARFFRRSYSYGETGVHCIAVWDTVGALGIPLNGLRLVNMFNRRYQFHDVELSGMVRYAFHATSIDEQRGQFSATLWKQQPDAVGKQTLKQVWFAGTHSDVGGGWREASLADVPLMWIVQQVGSAGLEFLPDAFPRVRPPGNPKAIITAPNAFGELHDSRTGLWRLLPGSPRTLGKVDPDHEAVSKAAAQRFNSRPEGQDGRGRPVKEYRPENLKSYLAGKHRIDDFGGGLPP